MTHHWHQPFLDQLQSDSPDRTTSHAIFQAFLNQLNPDGRCTRPYRIGNVESLNPTDTIELSQLTDTQNPPKTIVLKLNGGLATTLGCQGPKCLVIADPKRHRSFLDIIIEQNTNCPHTHLWLLNSFYTHPGCVKHLDAHGIPALIQNRWPCLNTNTQPVTPYHSAASEADSWAPPGHGDIFSVFHDTGVLDQWLANGYDYVFISNSDNLAATWDPRFVCHMREHGLHALVEATPKTEADKKGGGFVRHGGTITLLERGNIQASDTHTQALFNALPLFNTNSLWLSIAYLKTLNPIGLTQLIVNPKKRNETPIIQLESAMGSAIQAFSNVGIIQVPRNRFQPVKDQADLDRLHASI
ncbi:MAG: UTP--glucose-1-phosphate uridylyltransferase [bacterium]|nr:UTP--glucose-1-phosphate uridylyltransferase [bacterium]